MGTRELIERTKAVWQPYYAEELTQEDTEDIVANWSAYINVISQWVVALQNRTELGHLP